MTTVSLRVEGMQQLQQALREYGAKAEAEASNAINATGLELRGSIVKMIQRTAGTGRTYEKYNPRRTHTASAPGEPPVTDTGRLVSSIEFKEVSPLEVTVGSQVAYAAMLEFGTLRMAKRPAWVPAVESMRPKFIKRMEDAIARAAG